ncbi:lipase family protein [Nocardioides sp. AE5]|uniref:lipase family protein n=1 Tax=Nocardioides sp. AE5 TaxID=2962573 RepID=UPI002881D024|nr:lipase family protein [Nocardioides sp. AE5]MDT0203653.1 lipase family protein [Nocardioides sp. AE5]
MTAVLGMDTVAAREAGTALTDGAAELDALGSRIDALLDGFEWYGADAERTRETWRSTERPRITLAAQHLAELAIRLQSEADQQDQASSTGAGGATGTWRPSDGELAAASGGQGWMGRRLTAMGQALRRHGEAWADLGGKVVDVLTGRENWSSAEIAASAITVAGTAAGVGANAVAGEDRNWFGETSGHAGAPLPVGVHGSPDGRPPHTPPTDAASLMQGVADSYLAGDGSSGSVRVTTVTNADGQVGYVVAIAGTENWGPGAGPFVRDATANLHLMAGRQTAAVEAVEAAIAAAGVPPGANIMLVGHSQGGMIAGELATSEGFRSAYQVSNVMTFGAPIDHLDLDPDVRVLQVQHAHDVVPRLDLGGIGPTTGGFADRQQTVTLDSPAGLLSVTENHNYNRYVESVHTALGADGPTGETLRAWQGDPSLAPFLVGDGDTSSSVDVPIWRGEAK